MISKAHMEGNTCTLGAIVVKIGMSALAAYWDLGRLYMYTRANEGRSSKTNTRMRSKYCIKVMK